MQAGILLVSVEILMPVSDLPILGPGSLKVALFTSKLYSDTAH